MHVRQWTKNGSDQKCYKCIFTAGCVAKALSRDCMTCLGFAPNFGANIENIKYLLFGIVIKRDFNAGRYQLASATALSYHCSIWIQVCLINSRLHWVVTQIHWNMCTEWRKLILSFNLLLLILLWNERKWCVHTEQHKGPFLAPSARRPLINLTVEGSQPASWACFEAVMPDSLNRTAGTVSIQRRSKQRFQARR